MGLLEETVIVIVIVVVAAVVMVAGTGMVAKSPHGLVEDADDSQSFGSGQVVSNADS